MTARALVPDCVHWVFRAWHSHHSVDYVTRRNLEYYAEDPEAQFACEPCDPPPVRAYGVPDAPPDPPFATF